MATRGPRAAARPAGRTRRPAASRACAVLLAAPVLLVSGPLAAQAPERAAECLLTLDLGSRYPVVALDDEKTRDALAGWVEAAVLPAVPGAGGARVYQTMNPAWFLIRGHGALPCGDIAAAARWHLNGSQPVARAASPERTPAGARVRGAPVPPPLEAAPGRGERRVEASAYDNAPLFQARQHRAGARRERSPAPVEPAGGACDGPPPERGFVDCPVPPPGPGADGPARVPVPDLTQDQRWGLATSGAYRAYRDEPGAALGDGVIVVVMDSGLDYHHPDLRDRVWRNPSPDGDGNGLPGDVVGWDFVTRTGERFVGDARPYDDMHGPSLGETDERVVVCGDAPNAGHGTAVGGVVAAEAAVGRPAGIAPAARLMVVRVLDARNCSRPADIINGILYVMDRKRRIEAGRAAAGCSGAACRARIVINLSVSVSVHVPDTVTGGVERCRAASESVVALLRSTLQAALDEGILIVAAAGNDGQDLDRCEPGMPQVYPASMLPHGLVTVASLERQSCYFEVLGDCFTWFMGAVAAPAHRVRCVRRLEQACGLAQFSNYGASRVHLAAPGDGVGVVLPRLQRNPRPWYPLAWGTSFAAPLVSAAAALYWSRRPAACAAAVRRALLGSVTAARGLAGARSVATGGMLSIPHLLATPPDPGAC